jgi:hypothetical protein
MNQLARREGRDRLAARRHHARCHRRCSSISTAIR